MSRPCRLLRGLGDRNAPSNNTLRHDRRGITLIELTVASLVGVILTGVFLELLQTSLMTLSTVNTQGDLRTQLVQAVNAVSRDVSEARGRLASCCSGEFAERRFPFVTSGETVILEVPSIDADSNIINAQTTFDAIIYDINMDPAQPNPGKLKRIVRPNVSSSRPATTVTVANDIAFLQHTWLPTATNPTQLRLTLAAKREGGGRPFQTKDLTTEIALRNRPRSP